MKKRFEGISYSAIVVMLMDLVAVNATIVLAILVTQNFEMSVETKVMLNGWLRLAPWYSVLTLLIFSFFRLYRMIWSLVSLQEILRAVPAVTISCVVGSVLGVVLDIQFSLGVYFLMFVFTLLVTAFLRCSYRVYRSILIKGVSDTVGRKRSRTNVMIIGAGKAGQNIAKELQSMDTLNRKVCCMIDDNPVKMGRFLEGVPVVGDSDSILENVEKFDIQEIIFAIPSALPIQRRDILEICKQTGCVLKTLPGIYQMIDGEVSVKRLRDVSVEDLLARDPVAVNNEEILEELRDKTVLITGGGGSIGSELCRQVASHSPKRLVIFDIYENNAYAIQLELAKRHPELCLDVQIGSVRDEARVEALFAQYRPDVVFHAAAHKHVPLMEDSPCEAIKNNVFGTYHVASMAKKYHASRFVLISTDKAVNPTNIMGASKRLCEMVMQHMAQGSETRFAAVRFGNVLGSNGSVVPLFRRQIEEGGPVTVTDKDVIRYFMTIPEAVSLILQASAFAKNGEIYVLDMGEPVRIDDMARNMIRLCGLEPDVDIQVVYTGLRPGEKLFEELLMDEEGLRRTQNHLIFIGNPIAMDHEAFATDLQKLRTACQSNDPCIRDLISAVVPTYRRQDIPTAAN